jgi:uncharacterized damage-inducible protein DinB
MSIAERLLPEFDREFANTRKFLLLVPDDRLSWKPHERSMEMGRLAWHISGFTDRAVSVLTKTERVLSMEAVAAQRTSWMGKTREAIVANFDSQLEQARAALAALPDAVWEDRWQFKIGERVMMEQSRYTAYRMVVMNHQIHHRAQLGVYLRLNDIPVPGVYGASADEA